MSKYYTPEEKDFIIGFEFEYARPYKGPITYHTEGEYKGKVKSKGKWLYEDWKPAKVDTFFNLCEIFWCWGDNLPKWDKQYRAKYLDQEDIESLGFKLTKKETTTHYNEYLFFKNEPDEFKCGWELQLLLPIDKYYQGDNVLITWQNKRNKQLYEDCKFEGGIKNKSELKKVLQMIGVSRDD